MGKKTCTNGLFSGADSVENALGHYAVSLAGHDAGEIYLVTGVRIDSSGKRLLLLADGKRRPAANPKAKKQMHVTVLKSFDAAIAERLAAGQAVEDGALVSSVKAFKRAQNDHCEKEA